MHGEANRSQIHEMLGDLTSMMLAQAPCRLGNVHWISQLPKGAIVYMQSLAVKLQMLYISKLSWPPKTHKLILQYIEWQTNPASNIVDGRDGFNRRALFSHGDTDLRAYTRITDMMYDSAHGYDSLLHLKVQFGPNKNSSKSRFVDILAFYLSIRHLILIMTMLQENFPDLCLLWYFYRAGINHKLVPAHWIGSLAWFAAFIENSLKVPRRRDFGLFVMGKLPSDLNKDILKLLPNVKMVAQDDVNVLEGLYKSELVPEDLVDSRMSQFVVDEIRHKYYQTSTEFRTRMILTKNLQQAANTPDDVKDVRVWNE